MAAAGPSSAEGSLLALICDEDTATGLLLTGVGHVDFRKQSNFLIVDDSEWQDAQAPRSRGMQQGQARGRGGARQARGRETARPPLPQRRRNRG